MLIIIATKSKNKRGYKQPLGLITDKNISGNVLIKKYTGETFAKKQLTKKLQMSAIISDIILFLVTSNTFSKTKNGTKKTMNYYTYNKLNHI